jgi:hypothetical protein
MVNSVLRPDSSLPEALADRARSASDGRLALDVAGGVVALGAVLLWRPTAWFLLACAALCFACFGLWGITDRELGGRRVEEAGAGTWALRGARLLAMILGAVGAAGLIFGTAALALGTWIS